MSVLKRVLAYASLGAAKVAGEQALRSDEYIDSALSAAEAGLWVEAARNLLEEDFFEEEEDYP